MKSISHRCRLYIVALLAVPMASILGCAVAPQQTFAQATTRGQDDDKGRASIDDVMGPTERRIRRAAWEKDKNAKLTRGASAELLGAYSAAEKHFEAKRYDAAYKSFEQIHKRFRPDVLHRVFGEGRALGTNDGLDGQQGHPIDEDAQFMMAECQFRQGKYPWAQDRYNAVIKEYPSTKHLDTISRRMFVIARHWLDFPKIEAESNIDQVSANDAQAAPKYQPPTRYTLVPNLTDRTHPLFDSRGRALQALKTIWLNDATGPLADDALMLTASHYLQKGDYIEAARYFELLRDQFPDSPHLKDAYLLGSYVAQASYSGPAYDGRSLNDAKNLKDFALRAFPELSEEDRARLNQELDKLQDQEVARAWETVEYYQKKGNAQAVEIYANALINEHPESRYADAARRLLQRKKSGRPTTDNTFWSLTNTRRRRQAVANGAATPKPAQQTPPLPRNDRDEEPSEDAQSGRASLSL